MESGIHMHDAVALLEDVRATHFGGVSDVEFAGHDGRAYAILPLHASKLMVLRYTPDYAPA